MEIQIMDIGVVVIAVCVLVRIMGMIVRSFVTVRTASMVYVDQVDVHAIMIPPMVTGLEASVLNVPQTIMAFVVTPCVILRIVIMEIVMRRETVFVMHLKKMDTGWASNVMFVFLTTMALIVVYYVTRRPVFMEVVTVRVDHVCAILMMNMDFGLVLLVMFAKVDTMAAAVAALLSVILVIASMEAVMMKWTASVNRVRVLDTGMDLNAMFALLITMEVNARHSVILLFVSMEAVI